MRITNVFMLRVAIVSAFVFGFAAAWALTSTGASANGVSVKLVRTFSKSELVSLQPFSVQGILAVNTGDSVQLWDTRSRSLRATLPRHDKILDALFSSDGTTFVTTSREKSAGSITRLWDVQSGRLKATVSGIILYGPVQQSNGNVVVTLDKNDLKFWNAGTGVLQKTVRSYKGSFSDSIISPDGRLVVRYGGKRAYLWEAATGRLIAELTPPQKRDYFVRWDHEIKVERATFSPDSKIVATKDSLNSIQLWDTDTGRMRALLEGHSSTIYDLTFSRDGRLLASASRDGTARLWDVETGRLRNTFEAGKEIARRVQFNPAATVLAVGYQTQARLWDVSSGQLTATLAQHGDINKTVLFGTYLDAIDIMMSPEGKLLLTIGNKSVKVWTTPGGNLLTTLEGAHAPVAFSPDGKALAVTGRDNTVLLWTIND